MKTRKLAVAFVHGIEISDPSFAATPTRLLKQLFGEELAALDVDPDDALEIRGINWAAEIEGRQKELFARVYRDEGEKWFGENLAELVKKLNAGSLWALAPFLGSLLLPRVGKLDALHYPTARWLMMHFVGDALAYDRSRDASNYEAILASLGEGLAGLARTAGDDAPLCVIAHSFGTVVTSDYVYDFQRSTPGHDAVPLRVREAGGDTPLARGETLTWFYTMGSPMALFGLRYPDARLDRPIAFPGALAARDWPSLAEWVNLYDKDDIIAYPLRPLSCEYEAVVKEDRAVEVKGLPVAATPLVHLYYWADETVMRPIAKALADGWRKLNT